jgi:hypothetical protein
VKRWPELRAGLIALAICFGLLDGCPIPPPAETPPGRAWIVEPIRAVRDALVAPVGWLERTLRVTQRWALYQDPNLDRFWMELAGQTADGAWRVVYRVGDDEHAEGAALIEYARVRSAWDPMPGLPVQYRLFAAWLTGRALAAHPEFVATRLRHEKVRLDPGGEVVGTGEYLGEYVHLRARP